MLLYVLIEGLIELAINIVAYGGVDALLSYIEGKGLGRKLSVGLSIICCVITGSFLGIISLALLPNHIIKTETGRLVGCLLIPVAIGFLAILYGKYKSKKGTQVRSVERFVFAFITIFFLNLIRFFKTA